MATLHSIKKMQRNNKRINFLLHGTAAWEVKINLKSVRYGYRLIFPFPRITARSKKQTGRVEWSIKHGILSNTVISH